MTVLRALARSLAGSLPERPPQSGRMGLGGGGMLGGAGAAAGMNAYREVGAAYGPIRRICESVSLTDWALYQQTEQAGEVDRELLDDATAPARHPATALWTQPNPFMSRRLFLFIAQLWIETCGGCYWLMVQGGSEGSPIPQRGMVADIELWPIRPDRITPLPDPDKYLSGYVYQLGTERIPLPVAAVIPVGTPDPLDVLRFAGPLQASATDLDTERFASQYTRNTFLNGAAPGGVIEFEHPLPRDRFEELVLRWREQHQGINNAARVAIIEGGKWVDRAQTNRELQFTDLRRLNREEFMFALGMPFAMMQSNDINLANATMAEKMFSRWMLRPRLENVKEPLNLRVLPYLGDNLTMDYTLPLPEDEAFDVFSATSGWLAGLLQKNEGRQAMGYDAVENGDVYINDITGTAPPMSSATPPRRPTRLSYREKRADTAPTEAAMTDAWTARLREIRQGYSDLLTSRNAR